MSLSETIEREGGLSERTLPLLVKSDGANDVAAIWEEAGRPDVFVRIWHLGDDRYNVCAYERAFCGCREIFRNVVNVKGKDADSVAGKRDGQE